MMEIESHNLPTPGHWTAQPVIQREDWQKWSIVTDDYRHIAIVENDLEPEHVQANAVLIAASASMLAALKTVDEHFIEEALTYARSRGYAISWPQAEVMFGVTDLHAEVGQAIAAAEGR